LNTTSRPRSIHGGSLRAFSWQPEAVEET